MYWKSGTGRNVTVFYNELSLIWYIFVIELSHSFAILCSIKREEELTHYDETK